MAVKKIMTQTQTVELDGNGSHWLLGKGSFVKVSDGDAIYNPFADNISLVIAGSVITTAAGTVSGFESLGHGTDLRIAETGVVRGYFGLSLHGDQADVVNTGRIVGTGPTGIGIVGGGDGFSIQNSGLIRGAQGIDLNGYGRVVNEKGGVIDGQMALRINGAADCEVINRGTLAGDDWSFIGGAGDDLLVNRGRMTGGVDMGAGNDRIDLRGGKALDGVSGGEGNDVFFVDQTRVGVAEFAGEGYDMIWTTATFVLPDSEYAEFEFLGARGKADIALTGNDYDNTLGGNSGNNRLRGQGGEDTFYSGAGNDRLTGGGGVDTFVFRKGDDHDTITDFVGDGAEQDIVDLHFLKDFKTFGEVIDVASNTAAGVVLDLGKGDSLTIAGMTRDDLEAKHFEFAV